MRRVTLALMLVAAGCRQGSVSGVELEPLGVPTTPITFDDTFIGFSTQRTLPLTAPGKTARDVRLTVTGPFEAPERLQLPASESTDVVITFRPTAVGASEGTLELVDVARGQTFSITLAGQGLAVPDCQPSSPCVTSRFELSARGCVETPRPDDTPCTSPLSCFSRASCVAGQCRGTTVTCDDADPCTLDVCSDLGCGQVDGTPFCPGSENPCLVPTCSRDAGCGLAEVPDGTACGERSCTSALICISGSCVQRTPPKSQACADVLVGVPAGLGFVDGRTSDVRFSGIATIAVQGEDVLVVDDARIRHLRRGNVTTLAGRSPSAGIVDGLGASASVGSQRPTLAPTSTPGLFFLGDDTTIRLVSTRGAVTTLAGRPDAGGALDGIGAAARLSVNSPLTPGGSGARWVQVPRDSRALSPLLVREVSSTGAVRTLQSFDLNQLPAIDAGPGEFWFVYSTGVAQGDPLTAWVRLNDAQTSFDYRLTWTDGGVVVERAGEELRWASEHTTVTRDACRLTFQSDAGRTTTAGPSCFGAAAFDGDRTVYVGAREALLAVTSSGAQLLAGPIPDRRIVDGDKDAGRTNWPRSLSPSPEGMYFLDSTPSLNRARLLRFSPNGTRASLETVDAGLSFQTSLAFHQGQLWMHRDDNVGLVTVLEPSGALVRRFSSSVPNLGQLHSNGSVLRASLYFFHELSPDGGVRQLPGLIDAQASAPGPGGVWYVFAARDPNDGGLATEPRRLFRVEPDDSFSVVAGDVTKTSDSDGPALSAGITTMRKLTVAPDGTVFFLGAKNQLRQLRNGQVSTVMTLSDTPLDLVALPDGSLVVAVDAAFLRVFP